MTVSDSSDPGGGSIAFPIASACRSRPAGLGVAVGVGGFGDNPRASDGSMFEDFSTDPDRADPRFVALREPDSRVASLTWIGYEEFEEMWLRRRRSTRQSRTRKSPAIRRFWSGRCRMSPMLPTQPALPRSGAAPEPDDALELLAPEVA